MMSPAVTAPSPPAPTNANVNSFMGEGPPRWHGEDRPCSEPGVMSGITATGDHRHDLMSAPVATLIETMSQLATNSCCDPGSCEKFDGKPLLLVGNPNVGKSLLFTRLTNRYATVSNYPATTVEMTTAPATVDDEKRPVIDTPGINSLLPQSEDEIVARDLLLREPDIEVVQVGDIANLRRTLLL